MHNLKLITTTIIIITLRIRPSVSYTHLDVYKRQMKSFENKSTSDFNVFSERADLLIFLGERNTKKLFFCIREYKVTFCVRTLSSINLSYCSFPTSSIFINCSTYSSSTAIFVSNENNSFEVSKNGFPCSPI